MRAGFSFPSVPHQEIWLKKTTLTAILDRSSALKKGKNLFGLFLNKSTCQFHVFKDKNKFRNVLENSNLYFRTALKMKMILFEERAKRKDGVRKLEMENRRYMFV